MPGKISPSAPPEQQPIPTSLSNASVVSTRGSPSTTLGMRRISSSVKKAERFKGETAIVLGIINNLAKSRRISSDITSCAVVDPQELTKHDVQQMSSGLLFLIKQEIDEREAVRKFLSEYPSMEALSKKHDEFQETLENICSKILADQQRWAKIKLFVSAGVSIVDMITDIAMVVEYFNRNETNFALATLACLLSNLTCQAFMTFFQNRKQPFKRQLKEQAFVFSLVKPGIDAFRVASESEHEEFHMVDHMTEWTVNKAIELLAESIPGAVIQLTAIMKTGSNTSLTAAFSFIFCIFTAALTSTLISWDWDKDMEKRKYNPWFYGYLPDDLLRKVIVFFSLVSLSAFNLLTRSFAVVLIYLKAGFSGTAFVLGIELLFYLIVKVLRRDFWYWMPIYGPIGLFLSFMARSASKVICDWTAVVQLRHPNEVGGAFFSASFFITIILGMVAADGYKRREDNSNGDIQGEYQIDENVVFYMMCGICLCTTLSYAALLLSIKRKYLTTFISTTTSNEMAQSVFLDNNDDVNKFAIFGDNTHKWKYKIGEDVKIWLNERLPNWLDEHPDWFTDKRMSIIPEEMIMDQELLKRVRLKNVQWVVEEERRGSISMIVPSSRRKSISKSRKQRDSRSLRSIEEGLKEISSEADKSSEGKGGATSSEDTGLEKSCYKEEIV